MSLEIKGTIKQKLDIESGVTNAGKNWQRQTFVIDTGSQYNPLFNVGDNVVVGFNVSSREFKNKWYTSLDAWKIFEDRDVEPSSETVDVGEDDSSELPF